MIASCFPRTIAVATAADVTKADYAIATVLTMSMLRCKLYCCFLGEPLNRNDRECGSGRNAMLCYTVLQACERTDALRYKLDGSRLA